MTSHYQQQLAQQLRAAEDELGQRRRQVAELTEQRDTAQAAARERADILEHARDLLEPWGGHGDAWPDIAPAIETLIAEARTVDTTRWCLREELERTEELFITRIAAVRALHQPTEFVESWTCAECSRTGQVAPDWPCPTIRALDGDTVSTDAAPEPAVTLRTIGHWRPVCPDCRQLAHPGISCEQAAERSARYEDAMASVLQRVDRESSRHLGAAFTCDHSNPKKLGARPDDLALVCECGAQVGPALLSPKPAGDFRTTVTEPVEEIAAEQGTLDRLKAKYFGGAVERAGLAIGPVGSFFGFPLVVDASLPVGEVHLQPRPKPTTCGPDCAGGHMYDGRCLIDPLTDLPEHASLSDGPGTGAGAGWAWRCWGTDTCDGWLSLNQSSQAAARRAYDRHARREHQAADDPHSCRPGAAAYFCPTAGEVESSCHGGHDVCCSAPGLHVPIKPTAVPAASGTAGASAHWSDPLANVAGGLLNLGPARELPLPAGAGPQWDCPACRHRGDIPHPYDCPGHPDGRLTSDQIAAILHAWKLHPGWEYATTTGPRKAWDDAEVPPRGDDGKPDLTWESNVSAGSENGWERFDYHEEAYWRRPKVEARP